ncbi:hypothetical protein ABIA32_001382 [Streptacidiphilus sp. MAP12-20]|uniref:hypothetical protein n=1 Tax=Streptacidiphilus sp. MAP12-20 TaxID=3156299 RepID=UPI00351109BA
MQPGVTAKTMGHSGDTNRTGSQARDPFAPPPAGTPDRPWQPRGPIAHQQQPHAQPPAQGGAPEGGDEPRDAAPDGSARPDGAAAPEDATPPSRGRAQVPPPHPWSPGYQGQQPPMPRFPYPPQNSGPRFDPTDPVQRRARYAMLSGMWGFLFLILGIPYLTLLLGALALYWGISALRGEAKTPTPAVNAGLPPMPHGPGYYPTAPAKPQAPAAIGGLIAGAVGLALVGAVFGVQLYYKSYYDCQANALTKAAYNTCATSVTPTPPAWLVQLNGGG